MNFLDGKVTITYHPHSLWKWEIEYNNSTWRYRDPDKIPKIINTLVNYGDITREEADNILEEFKNTRRTVMP